MTEKEKLLEIVVKAKKKTKEAKSDIERNLIFVEEFLANGVIVPPCKVGDKVYLPCLNDWGDIENYTITEFVLDNDGLCFVVDDEDREAHSIEILGKEVFLTKEEAEAKLKELKYNAR